MRTSVVTGHGYQCAEEQDDNDDNDDSDDNDDDSDDNDDQDADDIGDAGGSTCWRARASWRRRWQSREWPPNRSKKKPR